MKKLMIVIFIFLVLISGKQENVKFSLLDYFSGEYTVYTSNTENAEGVNLGFCYMNHEYVDGCIVGESLVINNCEVGDVIKTLSAKVVKNEYLEDGTTVIYAHTNLLNKTVKVSGQRVNIQIAIKEDRTIVGWPLILGSY